jgi:hypothetical protein
VGKQIIIRRAMQNGYNHSPKRFSKIVQEKMRKRIYLTFFRYMTNLFAA